MSQSILEKEQQIFHNYPGCEINSECSEKMGKLLMKFSKATQTYETALQFVEKNGLPVTFLAQNFKASQSDIYSLYSSRCLQHRKNPIGEIQLMTEFLHQLTNKNSIKVFDSVTVIDPSETTTYLVPFEERPSYLLNEMIVFIKQFEGIMLHIGIDKKNNLKVIQPRSVPEAQRLSNHEAIACPASLPQTFSLDHFYTHYYCQKIWDISQNKFKIIQLPWACQ